MAGVGYRRRRFACRASPGTEGCHHLGALPPPSPPGAIDVRIHAVADELAAARFDGRTAHAAGNWTTQHHSLWVALALTQLCPAAAVGNLIQAGSLDPCGHLHRRSVRARPREAWESERVAGQEHSEFQADRLHLQHHLVSALAVSMVNRRTYARSRLLHFPSFIPKVYFLERFCYSFAFVL